MIRMLADLWRSVRLLNGDLFLHSPIKFDGRLANELLGLGAVRHLVSPNQFHYAHIGEWATAFPNTVLWASPRVRERARAGHVNVDFTRDLEASPPEEWGREIDQTLFPGGYFSRSSSSSTRLQRRWYQTSQYSATSPQATTVIQQVPRLPRCLPTQAVSHHR